MRADKYFAEKFGSRTKAAKAAETGLILVNGRPIKPNDEIKEGQEIVFLQPSLRYVSDGGYKLERAITSFDFSCKDKVFVDIGASTGGFTDCLLQNGAKKVYAVDVGTSQLCDQLRDDVRVVVMENTNARYLRKEDFSDEIDGIVTDVSFISLRLIFPIMADILPVGGEAVALIKPQFECENKNIGKSGIVRLDAHPKIVEKVLEGAVENGLNPVTITYAPIRKGKNVEYVVHLKKGERGLTPAQVAKTAKELLTEIRIKDKETQDKQ
ncbi:MAG: TlyA family RNA methyltransferase [Clostridia bacterium]|nr:TlyA family RNA methyltransferase [Clostridia bacterium]